MGRRETELHDRCCLTKTASLVIGLGLKVITASQLALEDWAWAINKVERLLQENRRVRNVFSTHNIRRASMARCLHAVLFSLISFIAQMYACLC